MTYLFRKILGVSLALVLLLTCALPGPVAAGEQKADPYDMEVIATVDGIPIRRVELLNAVNALAPSRAYHSAMIPEKRYEELQREALDDLILNVLIYEEAKEKQLDKVDPAKIDTRVERMKKLAPKGDTLEKLLERSNMTMEDLRSDIKKAIVIRKSLEERTEAFKKKASEKVTEAFLKDYYEKNLYRFTVPKKILLRNILIKVASASSQKVWNDTRKKTLELVKRARAGEDFAELAIQNSEGPKAAEGGDMGWAQRGSLMEEIDFTASAMKKGEVSDPIMTIYGYHIIKVEDSTPSTTIEFTKINKTKLQERLENREFRKLLREWKKELRSNAKIEQLKQDLY